LLRRVVVAMMLLCVFAAVLIIPVEQEPTTPRMRGGYDIPGYILLGGQNGTWFTQGQFAKLSKVNLTDLAVENVEPYDPDSQGTVWSGGWNGTQWLISGWGVDPGVNGSNPYLYLYDGQRQILAGSTNEYAPESTWRGGDIFCVSYNGHEWLLSGLGSGYLPGYVRGNHMALATFNGSTFIDYSAIVPNQADYILYANAWNGKYWLVGGGFAGSGALFTFNGTATVDLTNQTQQAVPSFNAVQAIAWNGTSWLIGGDNFLAEFDGVHFRDLTSSLLASLGIGQYGLSVNSIVWNGWTWIIAGGPTRASLDRQAAWLAEYNEWGFLTLPLPTMMTEGDASILSVAAMGNFIVAGGYANSHGIVLTLWNGNVDDLSYLIENDMSYVNWVAVDA